MNRDSEKCGTLLSVPTHVEEKYQERKKGKEKHKADNFKRFLKH